MHVFTHLKPSSRGQDGQGLYPDGMVELDGYVGQLLEKLDELGVADNTIVVFTTDNGAEVLSWPDGGATPFRGEKDTNWEGGWRVPMRHALARRHRARARVINDICSLEDLHSDVRGRRRRAELVEKVKNGYKVGEQDLQGPPRRLQPSCPSSRQGKESPRKGFLYWSDDGDLMALRVNHI